MDQFYGTKSDLTLNSMLHNRNVMMILWVRSKFIIIVLQLEKKTRRIIITKYKQTQSSHHITSHQATIDNETR